MPGKLGTSSTTPSRSRKLVADGVADNNEFVVTRDAQELTPDELLHYLVRTQGNDTQAFETIRQELKRRLDEHYSMTQLGRAFRARHVTSQETTSAKHGCNADHDCG